MTATGDILGTLRYMAPERFRGEGDARADIYALGLTLYELVTLRPAYTSSDRLKLVEQVKTEEPTRPRAIDDQIPRDLETIILKAIEKEPAPRYATAEAMAEDFRRFLDDEPIQARRASAAERFARWARHHPTIAALGAVVTAVLVMATLASVIVAGQMTQTAADERFARRQAEDSQKREAKERDRAQEAKKIAESSFAAARAAEEEGRKLLYATDMQLAPFIWKDAQATAAQLRHRLDAHDPAKNKSLAGKDDLRGFEWYYYQHLVEHSATVLSGHAAAVVGGALTALGQVVTLDRNGQVRHWDLGSQPEDASNRRDLPGGPTASVRILSPSGRLAALAEGNKVRLFDTLTGKQTLAINSVDDPFRRLIFSMDSTSLVVLDDKIRWLSTQSGDVIATVNQKFRGEVGGGPGLALSADGRTLAVVGHSTHDASFSIFRRVANTKEVIPLAKDIRYGRGLGALSPDGERLAIGSVHIGSVAVFENGDRPGDRRSLVRPRVAYCCDRILRRRCEAGHGGCRRDDQDLGRRAKAHQQQHGAFDTQGSRRGGNHCRVRERWQAAHHDQRRQNGQSLGSGQHGRGNSAIGTVRTVRDGTLFARRPTDRGCGHRQRPPMGRRHRATRAGTVAGRRRTCL